MPGTLYSDGNYYRGRGGRGRGGYGPYPTVPETNLWESYNNGWDDQDQWDDVYEEEFDYSPPSRGRGRGRGRGAF